MVVAKEPGKNLEELLQQIKQKEEPVNQAEEEKKEGAKKEDVDMTDEEEEEQRRMIEMLEKKKAQAKAQREVELSVQDNQQVKDGFGRADQGHWGRHRVRVLLQRPACQP